MNTTEIMAFYALMAEKDTAIQEVLEQLQDPAQQVKCVAAKERILELSIEELKGLSC